MYSNTDIGLQQQIFKLPQNIIFLIQKSKNLMLKPLLTLILTLTVISTKQQLLQLGYRKKIQLDQSNYFTHKQTIKTSELKGQGRSNLIIELQATEPGQYAELIVNVTKMEYDSVAVCKGLRHVSCVVLESYLGDTSRVIIQVGASIQGQYFIEVFESQFQEILDNNFQFTPQKRIGGYYFVNLRQDYSLQTIKFFMKLSNENSYSRISAKTQLNSTTVYQSVNMWSSLQGLFLSKLDLQGHTRLYLTLIGDIDEKYMISYEVITKDHQDLRISSTINQFLEKNQKKNYHIQIKEMEKDQQLVVSFMIFSGNPQIIFFQDLSMTSIYKAKYFQYMADSKFIFSSKQLDGLKNLYIQIRSNDHKSILKIETKKTQYQQYQLISESLYNFYSINPGQPKYLYFYIDPQSNIGESGFIYASISFMYVFGSSHIIIYEGKSDNLNCLPECLKQKFKQSTYTVTSIALKSVYALTIPNQNLDISSIVLISISSNNAKNLTEQVSIQYSFQKKFPTLLRQNYPLTQVVQMQKTKYYKYRQPEKYKSLRICVALISGDIGVLGYYLNPYQIRNQTPITPYRDCVEFNQTTIRKEYFVSVYGVSKSKYSISVQVMHSSELVSVPTLQTNQDVQYQVSIPPLGSYILILHPLYQNLRISYNSSLPVRICLLQPAQSSQSQSRSSKKGTQQCAPQSLRESQISGELPIKQPKNSEPQKLQVVNSAMYDSVVFRVKYHSGSYDHCEEKLLGKIYEEDINGNLCVQFQLQDLTYGDTNVKVDNAYSYDYEVIVNKMEYNRQQIIIGICDKQELKLQGQKYTKITKQQIKKACQGAKQPVLQIIVSMKQQLESAFKLQYIVQKVQQIVRLPLNVKFQDIALLGWDNTFRQFLIDPQSQPSVDIQVKEFSPIPIQISIYATPKSTPPTAKTYQNLSPIYTAKSSNNVDNMLTVIPLSKDLIESACREVSKQTWMECWILIVVMGADATTVTPGTGSLKIGLELEYSIKASGGMLVLKEYEPQQGILDKGEYTFYNYYPSLQHSPGQYKAGIQISTQNQPCLSTYITKSFQIGRNASLIDPSSSFDMFPIQTNHYMIQVISSMPNCHYTIQLSLIQNKYGNKSVAVLHPDVGIDLKMIEGEQRYFIGSGQFGDGWQVLYMSRYGEVNIYACEYNEQTQQKILKNSSYSLNPSDFPTTEHFPNTLTLPTKNITQAYILALQATSPTQGTLKMHSNRFPIVLPYSKMLRYSLAQSESVVARYYFAHERVHKGEIRVEVLSGAIGIEVGLMEDREGQGMDLIEMDQNDIQCCKQGINKIPFTFLTQSATTELLSVQPTQYLRIKITNSQATAAKQLSIFSISVVLDRKELAAEDIDKGVFNYLEIKKWSETVIKTSNMYREFDVYISVVEALSAGSREKFYRNFSTDTNGQNRNNNLNRHNVSNTTTNNTQFNNTHPIQQILDCLDIQICEQNKQTYNITGRQNIVGNVLLITVQKLQFKMLENSELLLDIVLREQCPLDSIFVSVAPNLDEKLTIMPPFKWAYFELQRNFVIATKDVFLIDIVSCAGPVQLFLAKNYQQLSQNMQNLQNSSKLAHQPHVYKIKPIESLTYFKLKSKQAIIRYIPINYEKQSGIGYLKYQWQFFQYETDFQKLTIHLKPIKNITQTNTTPISMVFLIKIIQGLDLRQSSLQCMQLGKSTIYQQIISTRNIQTTTVLISKQELLAQLQGKAQNLYLSIDLSIELKLPSGSTESYKFLAPVQQIPLQIFNITRLSNKIIAFGIFSIVGIMFICLGAAQCFLRVLVPFFGRVVGSNQLVEEEAHDRKEMEQLPASSDRNQRNQTKISQQKQSQEIDKVSDIQKVQTEQKMQE